MRSHAFLRRDRIIAFLKDTSWAVKKFGGTIARNIWFI
jgi:hypothetical protein